MNFVLLREFCLVSLFRSKISSPFPTVSGTRSALSCVKILGRTYHQEPVWQDVLILEIFCISTSFQIINATRDLFIHSYILFFIELKRLPVLSPEFGGFSLS